MNYPTPLVSTWQAEAEGCKFEASLRYKVKYCFKKNKKKTREKYKLYCCLGFQRTIT